MFLENHYKYKVLLLFIFFLILTLRKIRIFFFNKVEKKNKCYNVF